MSAYINFLLRDLPPPRKVPLMEFYPNLKRDFFLLTLFFVAVNRLVPVVLGALWPQWWKSLPAKKREEMPAYVVSLVHHCGCVPFGWLLFFADFAGAVDFSRPEGIHRFSEELLIPWCGSYLVADLLCYALPELVLRGQGEYVLHHALGLYMIYALLAYPTNLSRFVSHLVICETTGIFFCLAWILRAAGGNNKDRPVVKVLEALFALSFVFLRGVNVTAVFLIIFWYPSSAQEMGWGRFVFPIIAAMQWMWLYKILAGIGGRLFSSSSPAKESKDDKLKTADKKND